MVIKEGTRKEMGRKYPKDVTVIGRSVGFGVSCLSFLNFQFSIVWLFFQCKSVKNKIK